MVSSRGPMELPRTEARSLRLAGILRVQETPGWEMPPQMA